MDITGRDILIVEVCGVICAAHAHTNFLSRARARTHTHTHTNTHTHTLQDILDTGNTLKYMHKQLAARDPGTF
jgi:hypoxanthine-guanine phosphoribosyltransferase